MTRITGFYKGNQLWKKGMEAKNEAKSKLDMFFDILASGGISKYGELLGELAKAKDIEKPQKLFMTKVEGLLPYVKGRISTVELNAKVDIKIEKIEQLEITLRNIAGVGDRPVGSDEDETVSSEPVQE